MVFKGFWLQNWSNFGLNVNIIVLYQQEVNQCPIDGIRQLYPTLRCLIPIVFKWVLCVYLWNLLFWCMMLFLVTNIVVMTTEVRCHDCDKMLELQEPQSPVKRKSKVSWRPRIQIPLQLLMYFWLVIMKTLLYYYCHQNTYHVPTILLTYRTTVFMKRQPTTSYTESK